MKSRKTIIGVLVVAVVAAGTAAFFGFHTWRAGVIARQEQRAFARTQQLLAGDDFADALAIIRQQPVDARKLAWPPLEVRALAGLLNAPELAGIYQQAPQRILADESASLVLDRAYLASHNTAAYTAIRSAWSGHETRKADWLILDSDVYLAAGKSAQAEKILRSQKFTGKAEAARLERLALLVGARDLPQAWQLLSAATKLDSRNAELRSFRAQILEAAGKVAEARIEYLAAAVAETNNPLAWDQLAEFYRRQGDYDAALDTWEAALARPAFDFIALKTAFWQRLIRPGKFSTDSAPAGDLQPLARWISGLAAGSFFDTNSFADLPGASLLTRQRQEIFWLQLADDLQRHHENDAAALLRGNPFRSRSWQPDLEVALARIIHYRQKRSLTPANLKEVTDKSAPGRHELFIQLDALAAQERDHGRVVLPADLDALLRGPDAFAAAFLAAGWREAAVQLCDPQIVATNEPVWFAYGLAQDLRVNRGPTAAQDFLARQRKDSVLILLAAEIDIQMGQRDRGLTALARLAPENSQAGFRASYLLALAAVDTRDYAAARQWVRQSPSLSTSLTGSELLGEIAVRAGQPAEADRIYQAIAGHSIPARAYLAREAFDRRDWAEARRLTVELVQLVPEDLRFRANLAVIDQKLAAK